MNISFENIGKRFLTLRGNVHAVRDVSFNIRDGEFFVLLGPSGCGKSTLLNLTAGLERPTSGVIRFGDRVMADAKHRIMISPRHRNVAMVFQSYALYPHMTVYDNIAFPLKISRHPKTAIRQRVAETASLLNISGILNRKPGELSGGQRQRVAIARALVRNPDAFLMDEPLSNLDAQLRTGTRAEIKRIQRETGITTLYVTHDQTEAMTLGDRIALFKDGRLVQCGSPRQIYEQPETPFAGVFIGSPPMNLLNIHLQNEGPEVRVMLEEASFLLPDDKKKMLEKISGKEAILGIRPEHIRMSPAGEAPLISGRITNVEPLGREVIYHVEGAGKILTVLDKKTFFQAGENINLSFSPEAVHLFAPQG